MCGISIVIGKNPEVKARSCLNKIKHRGFGPCEIKKINNNLVFGFIRLPINDSSNAGKQPFEYENLTGVFNCEIYNHNELTKRFDLPRKSGCDAEIILPLFKKIGIKIIDHLDGFFSGVIYDSTEKSIYFIRDYIGKKPLFIVQEKKSIFIVSELKAVPKIDDFQILPKGVSKLNKNKPEVIYSHDCLKINSNESIKTLLHQAVKKRIPYKKHHPFFGVYLSGGLDSSIIVYLVEQITKADNNFSKPIYYFLAEQTDKKYSDRKYINDLIASLNISNSSMKKVSLPDKQLFDIIKKTVFHTESYNPSIISNGAASITLSQQVRKDGITVVLSGDGADEMFLGYLRLKQTDNFRNYRSELLSNLHFTELRRVDLTSMANTIEVRCPFLDKNVYKYSEGLNYEAYFGADDEPVIKNHLKTAFKKELPNSILKREKQPLDVGSGIQKKILILSNQDKKSDSFCEWEYFKKIWLELFPTWSNIVEKKYFREYPSFDKFIKNRAQKYNKIPL